MSPKTTENLFDVAGVAEALHRRFCLYDHNAQVRLNCEEEASKAKWLEKARKVMVFSAKYSVPLQELLPFLQELTEDVR